ncbi:YdeI/OmpD-associated family protein [Lutibacter citreus]|uniref:YdeI/OmpD-associated family protein n=1 Tax=Lutibacter citreus TaxID=2138210 RepID=UPI000DBE7462|nr:YdeI/OmpD-associated family protein [Lutibacter citreus]
MKDVEEHCPYDKKEWRKWLELNHNKNDAVWLILYKKKSSNHNLSWSESVDEALCFGWIDSTKKTIDKERYIQYFSKRKPNSIWSKVNKDKVEYLTSKNLIREAGYKAIETAKENGSWFIMDEVEALILPKDLKEEFDKRNGALEYYESLSKSAKKILLSWIVLAKRPETKLKRIIEIAENASKNTKPKQFR